MDWSMTEPEAFGSKVREEVLWICRKLLWEEEMLTQNFYCWGLRIPPQVAGSTSSSVWENVHTWPSKSCAVYWRSP